MKSLLFISLAIGLTLKATTALGAATATASSTVSITSSADVSCPGATKFELFGVNESGAEFGTAVPGVLGTDYTWPETTSIDVSE